MNNELATPSENARQSIVLGMSHIEAIRKGIPEQDKNTVNAISLNDSPDLYDPKTNILDLEKLPTQNQETVFLSIGGNFYNIFGLLENPRPFKVHGSATINTDEKRTLIPREMMKNHFRSGLDRLTKHLAPLREHFSNCSVYHICSPPPVEDAEHIKKYPGVFGKRLEMGIAPSGLRKNLYDIQSEIYQEVCQKLDIKIINPPTSSINESGFLKGVYLNNDPTHANSEYGTLVWSQMKECIHG